MSNYECIILDHLKKHRTITSMEAIQLYGITRLAAVIFQLRKHHNITRIDTRGVNRYGDITRFATYIYNGESEE